MVHVYTNQEKKTEKVVIYDKARKVLIDHPIFLHSTWKLDYAMGDFSFSDFSNWLYVHQMMT